MIWIWKGILYLPHMRHRIVRGSALESSSPMAGFNSVPNPPTITYAYARKSKRIGKLIRDRHHRYYRYLQDVSFLVLESYIENFALFIGIHTLEKSFSELML